MKNNLNLSVPKPCSETWNSFTPAKGGGFCDSCSKVVVDFTTMSDDQIVNFFAGKPSHTCGRFRQDQLKMYSNTTLLKINPGLLLVKAGFLSLLVALMSNVQSYAQNITPGTRTETAPHQTQSTEKNIYAPLNQVVKGVVKTDEAHLPLSGVSIYLKDSNEGTVSDADGRFEFPRKLNEGDVLVFSFIGFDSQEYVISDKTAMIEIVMKDSSVMIMGDVAVDRPYAPEPSRFRRMISKVKAIF